MIKLVISIRRIDEKINTWDEVCLTEAADDTNFFLSNKNKFTGHNDTHFDLGRGAKHVGRIYRLGIRVSDPHPLFFNWQSDYLRVDFIKRSLHTLKLSLQEFKKYIFCHKVGGVVGPSLTCGIANKLSLNGKKTKCTLFFTRPLIRMIFL